MMTSCTYPDTAGGAKLFLFNVMTQKPVFDEHTKIYPDPSVQGVWGVEGMLVNRERTDAIVYLRGYPDPMGRIRETNDFEIGEME